MVKSKEEVIAQFNEEVNMTVEELEAWLEDPKSRKAGTGVGIESGHKIIEILRKNPTKDPEKYDDDDLEHMRKVVGYANRHLAQEDKLKETKTRDELENTKSTISLKNWGHDSVKALDEENDDAEDGRKDKSGDSGGQPEEAVATKVDEGETEVPQTRLDNDDSKEPNLESTKLPEDNTDEAEKLDEGTNDSKKRKLDDDEPAAAAPEVNEAESIGDDIPDEANEDGEADQEERPRKKSKVDGEVDIDTAA